MTEVLVFLFGAVVGFAGGWYCYARWGAKVKAVEDAASKA